MDKVSSFISKTSKNTSMSVKLLKVNFKEFGKKEIEWMFTFYVKGR